MKFSFVLVFILFSCSNHTKGYFKTGSPSVKYVINLPKGFVFEGLASNHEVEKRYWYPDSAVVYFTTFTNTLNYHSIRKQGTYYKRFDAIHMNDTITLHGQDSIGLFWKDRIIGSVTVGYSNVPFNKKDIFDNMLSTMKIKDKSKQ